MKLPVKQHCVKT